MNMALMWGGLLGLAGAAEIEGRWVHPLCEPLMVDRNGPFALLEDGSIWTVDEQGFRTSEDDGISWSDAIPVASGIKPSEPASFHLVRTRNHVLVMVYLDLAEYQFRWDDLKGEPQEGCKLELWSVRSLDQGKTWVDHQRLLDGYNANFFGFIETSGNVLVATVEHLVSKPGRWVSCSFFSEDEGKTWKRSNLIDIGGHGHHDGATEPTVAELSDGRLMMLMRTNLDRFWQAFSEDRGRYWRVVQPSSIDASSAPGYLLALKSGRLVLVWNRLNPEGGTWKKSEPGPASETPASWHREELSMAFSEDDGKTWTPGVVLAKQKGGQLSYPLLMERRPGEIWIVAGFAFKDKWKDPAPFRVRLREESLFREALSQDH